VSRAKVLPSSTGWRTVELRVAVALDRVRRGSVELPRVLARGVEHEFAVQYQLPEPAVPHAVRALDRACDLVAAVALLVVGAQTEPVATATPQAESLFWIRFAAGVQRCLDSNSAGDVYTHVLPRREQQPENGITTLPESSSTRRPGCA
jgi:hypothetical protein